MLFKIDSALNKKETPKNLKSFTSKVIICNKASTKKAMTLIGAELQNWQLKELKDKSKAKLTGKSGPVWFLRLDDSSDDTHAGHLNPSKYAVAREAIAPLINEILLENAKEMKIEFLGLEKDQIIGALVGMELSLYRFEASKKFGKLAFTHNGKKLTASILTEAKSIATAINQARHLVNLPPNQLHPVSYAKEIKKMYTGSKTMKVSILDEKKLAKEKCGLLLSVGNSSNNPPRIVHIKYRPAGAKGKSTALVGKGLTFDSGGLDIKSAAGMRLMKKDMGGSATLVGFSRWLETSKVKKNVDIYLAIAENAISEKSSRPSDIFTARNGMKVEIHNTDAEGRLALADAISIALDAKPEILIDVATLTGAGKVALGQDIASLFSNNDKLANDILAASQKMGDLAWRMPLYNPYMKGLNSDFADMTNAASGHGGAITAALFLEKFVGKTKWAHLDIFGWTSSNKPSLVQKGGSGQAVETLIGYFS
jgi:leucyl aminopeptidase